MDLSAYLKIRWFSAKNRLRLLQLTRQIAAHEEHAAHKEHAAHEEHAIRLEHAEHEAQTARQVQPIQGKHAAPVVFFNASARLRNISQNAAFSLLSSWGLRLGGVPVVHYVCQSGMKHCILGTNRQNYQAPPPCSSCIAQSRRLYAGADVRWFTYLPETALVEFTRSLSVDDLSKLEYPIHLPGTSEKTSIPLGKLVLPAARWALRRHTLPDDQETRYLLREYIHSAFSIALDFATFANEIRPAAAVIFNGIMYPEASVRWVCQQRKIPVITHEVSFQPFSAFFTTGDATAYPLDIPEAFELSEKQNASLDAYLEKRFQGKFSMAGIHFWPEMQGLDAAFLERISNFKALVPIFTNVIYDTSQIHANQVFPHMFAWLDTVLETIRAHPETLFVIRAHPDEMRPDSAKQSKESVHDWVEKHGVRNLPNVVFIDSQEYISSYELIQRAKFVIVYNSSIGMEATLMNKPVLCGGKARYTQYPMVFFPATPEEYHMKLEEFLAAEEIQVPPDFYRNARRFLYFQLYRASLSFSDYLVAGPRKGFVGLKAFSWQALKPENSATIQVLLEGLEKVMQQAQPGAGETAIYSFLTKETP